MFRSFVLAAALAFAAAAPAPVQAAPAATAPDAATVAMAEQAITNLGLLDAVLIGFEKDVRTSADFSDMTDPQKERYIALVVAGVEAERPSLTHKLALGAVAHMTRDEMTNMLALSKIGYLKALVQSSAQGAADPDPAMMSADEKALYDTYDSADFVGTFFDGADIDLVGDDLTRIGDAAYAAWAKENGINEG